MRSLLLFDGLRPVVRLLAILAVIALALTLPFCSHHRKRALEMQARIDHILRKDQSWDQVRLMRISRPSITLNRPQDNREIDRLMGSLRRVTVRKVPSLVPEPVGCHGIQFTQLTGLGERLWIDTNAYSCGTPFLNLKPLKRTVSEIAKAHASSSKEEQPQL